MLLLRFLLVVVVVVVVVTAPDWRIEGWANKSLVLQCSSPSDSFKKITRQCPPCACQTFEC
jgi:hypothetical protein